MQLKKSWDGIYTKPDNLVESFETAISKYGNNRFIGTKDQSGNYQWVTYGHLGERVDHLRAGLAGIGIEKDDAVGIISTNSADLPPMVFPRDLCRCMKRSFFRCGDISSRMPR
jgi:long-subunit acyl-CoA synthetase (AMP-forming)